MRIRALRKVSALALCVIVVAMCWPQRVIFGLDLGDLRLQSGGFAACMLLWALARGGRLRNDAYFEFRSSVWQPSVATIRGNVARLVLELLALAASLEIVQAVLPHRQGAMGDFFVNALGIIGVGALIYAGAALALRSPFGRRIAQLFTTFD